ncbi:unnamed protein product [Darwinula stevensoni]|uniref:Cytochrome P450 n=1 Tax=Darwinula stevensoni TaxID=69355 RepID=A0A7R9FS86_9CRUS|nr:unnamed protein product [Darwinula stevensoni]CAG0903010.1 unnamed protein product [Darwinula stevensoni]
MQGIVNKYNQVLADSRVLDGFHPAPNLVYLWPPALRAYRRIHRNMTTIKKTISDEVEEHKKNLPLSGEPNDYIDAYLMELEELKRRGEMDHYLSESGLRENVVDLFIVGNDTTAHSIRWCVLFLLCHPQIQEKLQVEVDNVVGSDRTPSLKDRNRMPYAQAFTMEVLRLSHLGPLGVPHESTEDADIAGYRFPKGTTFVANVWWCHMNPKFWPDPEKFEPERFLNPDGSVKTKVPSFLPFSLGKRQCIGESLALMELFLFIAIFMQKFTFRTTTGLPHPKAEGVDSITIKPPKPFQFLVEERKH